jgi:hypothetical protein
MHSPTVALAVFPKCRKSEPRTDDELVRIHVGRLLLGRVDAHALRLAQDDAANRVTHSQMQVAINDAIAAAIAGSAL